MQFYFPDFSDLSNVSSDLRMFWEQEYSLRLSYDRYFHGAVFKDKVELAQPTEGDVLLYPVGLNLVKMLTTAHADGLWGEWEDQIVSFEPRREDVPDTSSKAASQLLSDILNASNANSMLWEAGLEREVYGGVPIQVVPDFRSPAKIRWHRIPIQSFFPVFDPDNPDVLLEAYVITPMVRDQARLKFGYDGDKDIVVRTEHWTSEIYTNDLDGVQMEEYSGYNPWHFVPFRYIPRYRTNSYFGDALTGDIIPIQDELNMRVADISEAINYNAHPIKYGFNLPSKFNQKNYSLGPGSFWDLGRVIGGSAPPEVGILEAKRPIAEGTFEYLKFIYDWGRISSSSPPIVFGEDNGGGQRSGATLEIRMWSYIKSIRRSRAYMINGLRDLAWMSAKILEQKQIPGISKNAIRAIIDHKVEPVLADIMPKDHQAIVDEVVKLMSTRIPTISVETSVKKLGLGTGEVDRIKADMKDEDFYREVEVPMSEEEQGEAGKKTPQPTKKEADSEDK